MTRPAPTQAGPLSRSDSLDVSAGLQHVYKIAPIGMCFVDRDLRFVRINDRLAFLNGKPAAEHIGRTVREMIPSLADHIEPIYRRVIETGEPALDFEARAETPNWRGVGLISYYPVKDDEGHVLGVSTFVQDITARKQAEMLHAGCSRSLELLATGAERAAVLEKLASSLEAIHGEDFHAVILLLEEGRPRHAAAPSLPEGFVRAIEGLSLDPESGSCTAALLRGEPLVVADMDTDPSWAECRDLVRSAGLRSCWSEPIVAADGQVLGAFALFHERPLQPTERQLDSLRKAAHVARIAVEHTAAIRDLRDSRAALGESRERLRSLAGRLMTAQEEERRHLARELHDDLTQRLAVLAMDVGKLEGRASPSLREDLRGIHAQLVRLSGDVHRVSRRLHPSILEDLGLSAAVESECQAFREREGIALDLSATSMPHTLSPSVALCAYRILQEGLRNIAKHARTRTASVSLHAEGGSLVLEIRDDGVGFDPGQRRSRPGMGLVSMEERADLLGGMLTVDAVPSRGTRLTVMLPLHRSSDSGHRAPLA